MSFYYDTDRSGYNGTLIQSGISAPAGSGSTVWNTPSVPGGTYYLYAVVTDGYNTNRFYATGPVIVNHSGIPTLALSRQAFVFGAIQNGTATPAEKTTLTNTGTGTLNWTATRSADWISVSPTSGTGNGIINIGIARTDLSPGTYSGTVTVSDPNASNTPQVITVAYTIYGDGADSPPFGAFETPVDGAMVASSIAVTGWVLDDIGMQSVKIYRGTGLSDRIYIGDAVFVEGARPDVASAYPNYPQNCKAGWGYMLLTNFLPNGGNGGFSLLAYAVDLTGHEVLLGTMAITCDNAAAVLPFGAIDTPTQGGTAAGTGFFNFGWALTPMPASIPTNGSTITVWVDGAPLGHPSYNNYRGDIATLFPGYANSNGAIGVYSLNTTTYAEGCHTIVWSVTDSAGHSDGIGSRYFMIQNLAAPGAAAASTQPMRPAEETLGMREDARMPVFAKKGMDVNRRVEMVLPEADGAIRITIPEVTRVAVYLSEAEAGEDEERMTVRGTRMLSKVARDDARYEAYEIVLGELKPLPIGASFDPVDGVLYWQPGPGFLGEYTFVIVDTETRTKRTIKVTITP